MTRNLVVLFISLSSFFIVSGCSSDGSTEAKSIIKNQANVTENYVTDLANAKNADDVVGAIEHYTEKMKKLIPELQEFQKKYPDYQQGKLPEGMEADIKRMEEASAKIPAAMMKVAQYMMNPKVQEAMTQMGKEMENLHQ